MTINITPVDQLPAWARARLSFDRILKSDTETDDYIDEALDVLSSAEFRDFVIFTPVYSSKSSIEIFFERKSQEAILLWDIDCLERLDGLFAMILSKSAGENPDRVQHLNTIAFAHLTAGPFLLRNPAIAMQIMTLACSFDLIDLSIIVDDERSLDKFRRLTRIYLLFHELGHAVYRFAKHEHADVDQRISNAIEYFRDDPDVSYNRISGMGEDIPTKTEILEEMEASLLHPHPYEEIWCDIYAIDHFLNWSKENNIGLEYCYAVDRVLHLLIGGRLQWQCFWSQSNKHDPWDDHSSLQHHQTRANIRDVIFQQMSFAKWLNKDLSNNRDIETLLPDFRKFRDICKSLTDPLINRFHERTHLAFGCLNEFDRQEIFDLSEREWSTLSRPAKETVIKDITHDLTWA